MMPRKRETKRDTRPMRRPQEDYSMLKRLPAACCAALTAASMALAPVPAQADVSAGSEPVVRIGDSWVILAGSSLKSTLEGWTRAAGWTLVWDSPIDFRVRASASYKGSFKASATALLDSINRENPELAPQFYNGNKVLHVSSNPLTSN